MRTASGTRGSILSTLRNDIGYRWVAIEALGVVAILLYFWLR